MNFKSKKLRALAIASVAALSVGSLSQGASAASQSTFNVWWYENGTAMATTWKAALAEFSANHPELKINFQLKTWAQLQNAGNALLSSGSAPDLTEWNKGNATAGTASAAGILSPLDGYDSSYHWDKVLTPSVKAYGQYNSDGIMGSGRLYGVPSYGEYVSWFYNKDLFAKYNVTVPTTFDDLQADLAKFKAAGVTPISMSGKDYLIVHMMYGLTMTKANLNWVKAYQSYSSPVNFSGPEWSFAPTTVVAWNKAGYFSPNVAGTDATTAVNDFEAGKYPLLFGGTWLDQDVEAKATSFKWGKFTMPGNLVVGSAGNLLVIPSKSKHKADAAEFINMILSTKYQNMLADNGGLPIGATAAHLASEKDPVTLLTNQLFNQILTKQGLGMYPDWPAAGQYNELLADETQLLTDGNVASFDQKSGAYYNANNPANS